MNQDEYISLCKKHSTVELIRPFWNYHRQWNDITVLICQRNTKTLIQLCLESLLTYYPDIPILIVDGNSDDDSIFYLRYKSLVYPNIKIWERKRMESREYNSHGISLHEAIIELIKTKYVLLLDSDCIIKRAGFIEAMLSQFSDNKLYATGTMMIVSNSKDGHGAPKTEEDILFYPHPSCSIFRVDIYNQFAPFGNYGSPCVYNIKDAISKGWKMGTFPVDEYVMHLSGASWTIPRTIWSCDNDIFIRPFISFIINCEKQFNYLSEQSDSDFEIIPLLQKEYIDNIVIHKQEPGGVIKNKTYRIRFNVHGEYICKVNDSIRKIDKNFVHICKLEIIKNSAPDEISVGGLGLIKRKVWQSKQALK